MTLNWSFFKTLVVVLIPLMAASCSGLSTQSSPTAQEGTMDLSGWDFKTRGAVQLNGEWDYYWMQRLTPEDFSIPDSPEKSGVTTLSAFFKRGLIKKTFSYKGYATFRLKVLLPPDISKTSISFEATRIIRDSKIWLNKKLLEPCCTPGFSEEKNRDQVCAPILIQMKSPKQVQEIVIQIGNFRMLPDFIPFWSIRFGRYEDLRSENYKSLGLYLILAGAGLIMGLYHLILFFSRLKNPSNLYFGLFCLLCGGCLIYGSGLTEWLPVVLPGLTWQLLFIYSFGLYYLMIIFFVMFVHSLFPDESPKKVVRLSVAVWGFWTIATFLKPFLSEIPPFDVVFASLFHPKRPSEILLLIQVLYIVAVLIIAARHKRPGARLFLLSIAILCGTVINDVLMLVYFPSWVRLTWFGIFGMLICQAAMLARVFSRAFIQVERLSGELRGKNISLSRLDRLKDEFIANTSHELRTPLSGIIGLAESMQAGAAGTLTPSMNNTLSMMITSGRRLAGLINDLLDFSRLKNRDLILHSTTIDLKSLADNVVTVMTPLAKAKGLSLVSTVPDRLQPVFGDEDRILQILYNLVGNAVKFTEKGGVTISAAARDTKIEVTVADTGIGIPKERQEDIFLSFEQVDTTAARKFGGTGLGLSITKDLVELHGGSIWVQSDIDNGATFYFTLPAAEIDSIPVDPLLYRGTSPLPLGDEPESLPAPPRHIPGQDKEQPKYTVLVVDDDPVNLQVAANHILTAGHGIRTATSGKKALDIINNATTPDLVLLDIMMPGMTGYEVCRRIRTRHTASILPVVILTAMNRITDLVKGFETGANDYLTKPFSREELLSRVNTQLQLKKAYETLAENVRLKRELSKKEETEHYLRLTQRRLSYLLDTVNDAVIAVNESREITFSNQACRDLFGYAPPELLGRPVWTLFEEKSEKTLRHAMQENPTLPMDSVIRDICIRNAEKAEISADIVITNMAFDDEYLSVLLIRLPGHAEDAPGAVTLPSLALITELGRNQERLHTLEEILSASLPENGKITPAIQQEIDTIDMALTTVSQSLINSERKESRRELAVILMNLCLEYWEEATGTDKFELSRRSCLWTVYTNQDGWERAQTLDRYLDIAALPKRPRWKLVFSTVDFVLSFCDDKSPLRSNLESALVKFRFACKQSV